MAKFLPRSAIRVYPYYRIPQLTPRQRKPRARLRPVCTAIQPKAPVGDRRAATRSRAGAFRDSDRYPRVRLTPIVARRRLRQPSLAKRLLVSALWVIGIPTGITLIILIAAWFTERVWVPTQLVVGSLAGTIF